MDNYPSDNHSTPINPPMPDDLSSPNPAEQQAYTGHIHPVEQVDDAPGAPHPAAWSSASEPASAPSPVASIFTATTTPESPLPVASASTSEVPSETSSLVPQAVVRVLSPRGVEYVFLTIALFTGAIGLISALISLVNGKTDFNVLEFPAAVLLVSIPIFAWLFLRLKKAELIDPKLKLDPSKRRSTQFMQIFSFIICFFTLIGFVSLIFAKMAGQYGGSSVKVFLDVLVILLVAGGILFYYWRDEHRSV